MRLPFRIPLGAAETNPNPRSSPTTVPEKNLIVIPDVETGTDESPKSLVLVLEGTAANTAVVQPWIVDDTVNPKNLQFAEEFVTEKANRKYYQYGTAVTLTVGVAQLLVGTAGASTTVPLPAPKGRVYLQVTTGPAAAADLKVGWLGA